MHAPATEAATSSSRRWTCRRCASGTPRSTCVVSFETIEHVADREAFLREVTRVLRPSGTFVVSTPNAPRTTDTPENPFHHVEYALDDFVGLLSAHFANVDLFGQRRLQTRRHRVLQRLDVLGLRRRLAFLRRAAPLVGTAPTEEVSLEGIVIERAGIERASELVADLHGAAVKIVHQVLSGDVAGGQLVALQLARAAREAGHDVRFSSSTDGPFLGLVRREGFAAEVIPIRGALDVRALWRLARAFRAMDADIVHTHGHFCGQHGRARRGPARRSARALPHAHRECLSRRARTPRCRSSSTT